MEFLDHNVYKLKTLITIVRLPPKHLLSSVLLPAVLATFPPTVVYTGYYETYCLSIWQMQRISHWLEFLHLWMKWSIFHTVFGYSAFCFVNFPFISLVHFYSLFVLLIYELTKAAHSFWVLDPNPLHAPNRQFSGQQLSVPQFILNPATIHPETASESTGSGLSPRRPPPAPNFRFWSEVLDHLCFGQPATNWRFPPSLLWVPLICKSGSQNSEKDFTL